MRFGVVLAGHRHHHRIYDTGFPHDSSCEAVEIHRRTVDVHGDRAWCMQNRVARVEIAES